MSNRKIEFLYNEAFEFEKALFWGLEERQVEELFKNYNFRMPESECVYVNRFKEGISSFVWSEVRYFSNIMNFDLLVRAFIRDYNCRSIEELFEIMEDTPTHKYFRYIGGIFISKFMKKTHSRWDEVYHDVNLMREFIEKNTDDSHEKEVMVQSLKNHEETKERIIFTIKSLWKRAFLPIQDDIKEIILKQNEEYTKEINEDFLKFKDKYYFIKDGGYCDPNKTRFLTSFFQLQPMSQLDPLGEFENTVILSTRAEKLLSLSKIDDGMIENFLKALSDKKKIRIIKMLSIRPEYGYRIAQELDITPATVNYHINILVATGIIDMEKSDNKIYFCLNKEKFKDMMERSKRYLLGE